MKQLSISALFITILLVFGYSCKKEKDADNSEMFPCEPFQNNCYKGRLEIDDICGNYTIKVLEGDIDTSLIQTSWKHPKTNITYNNVFSLGNICSFPSSIKQGDEFYFQIRDNKQDLSCVRCLAYVPTPDKILSIIASTTPCSNNSN